MERYKVLLALNSIAASIESHHLVQIFEWHDRDISIDAGHYEYPIFILQVSANKCQAMHT